MNKKIIIYIIVIIVILAAVFFSQQAYSKDVFKNILSIIEKNGGASLLGAFNLNSGSTANVSATDNNDKNLTSTASSSTSTASAGSSTNIDAYSATNGASAQLVDTASIPHSIGDYIANGVSAVSGVSAKVGESIQNGGAALQNGASQAIDQGKQIISDGQKKIENYISGITNAVEGKTNTDNTTCPPAN